MSFFKKSFFSSKKTFGLFLLFLLVSAGVRCYRPLGLTIFLDDQARDVLVAAQVVKEGKVPFIGPMASIGSLYLGPLFYWMITPFLLLANFNPVGPILLMAFLGWLTNVWLFFLMVKYFNLRSAFISAWLYALSPLVVHNTRFIWNPNPVPLFTLIFLWFLLSFLEKGRFWSLFWVGTALGVLIQLHYVTGVLFVIVLVSYFFWLINNHKQGIAKLFKAGVVLLSGIVFPLVPFILFEVKNYFINTRAGWRFVFEESASAPRLMPLPKTLIDLLGRFSAEALVVDWALIYFLINFLAFSGLFFLIRKERKLKKITPLVLSIFLLTLLTVVVVIKGQIHLHYLGLLLPVFFIIIGAADYFLQKIRIFKKFSLSLVSLLAFLLILFTMIKSNYQLFFRQQDNQQVNRARDVAGYIAQRAENKDIFVTSLSGSPYAYTYRYYLYLAGFKTDSLRPSSVFAICEDGGCDDPEGHPLWEIAQFGVLKTVSSVHVSHGVWVYELKKVQN
ncbi:MAG: glycosyltransferase family 39 protein [Candidatus Shapirobacteria bacterium]|nr:glycosyltransferase family 39 protein [Candidatus Shapirobacteria bacterium]